jgi:predicted O-linked N-acetylglucosamine transferase (SPINDLY family)
VSYLGYGYTTGLKSIDYFLSDEEMFPRGFEHVFSEAPLRVDVPCFAYQPPTNVPAVAPAPCLKNGYITFGSLSRSIRLNQRCLNVWLAILNALPNSHLVLNSFSFREAAMEQRLTEFFVSHGIAAERLDIACTSPPWPVYERIDIMLDCFPHNSGTTLFEGLYMGVPFITRRDRVSMGRLGATIARGLNRTEWIADTDEDYIVKALTLASDNANLANLRAQLRQQLMNSALGDGAGFTKRVESAFRQIWQQWCDEKTEQKTALRDLA